MKKLGLILLLQFCTLALFAQQLRIPVVVHVVYNAGYDIPDAEISKVIDTINRNFAGLSSNNGISRQIFDTLIADTEIKFCLASKAADGSATTGILHVQTSVTPLQGDLTFPRHFSPAWDETQYCNIWISSAAPNRAGSQGICTSPALIEPGPLVMPYGVCVTRGSSWNMFQNTLTHELGHFVGLYHTFETDSVADTPCTTDGTYDDSPCSSASLNQNTCSAEDPFWGTTNPPDMLENYMSYKQDCGKMFTKGQKARMRYRTMTTLASLLANPNTQCTVTGIETIAELPPALVAPNPVTDIFRLKGITGKCSLALVNAIGQTVLSVSEITDGQPISIGSFAPGVYYVRIISQDSIRTVRLIKN